MDADILNRWRQEFLLWRPGEAKVYATYPAA